MNDLQIISCTIGASGLLLMLVSIPLIFRKIPRNKFYGIRTRAAFASERDWYRINHIGGVIFVISGFMIFITGVLGFFVPFQYASRFSIAVIVITFLVIIFPAVFLMKLKPSSEN